MLFTKFLYPKNVHKQTITCTIYVNSDCDQSFSVKSIQAGIFEAVASDSVTLNVHFSISLADRTLTFAQRVRTAAVDPSPAHAPASHVEHSLFSLNDSSFFSRFRRRISY